MRWGDQRTEQTLRPSKTYRPRQTTGVSLCPTFLKGAVRPAEGLAELFDGPSAEMRLAVSSRKGWKRHGLADLSPCRFRSQNGGSPRFAPETGWWAY